MTSRKIFFLYSHNSWNHMNRNILYLYYFFRIEHYFKLKIIVYVLCSIKAFPLSLVLLFFLFSECYPEAVQDRIITFIISYVQHVKNSVLKYLLSAYAKNGYMSLDSGEMFIIRYLLRCDGNLFN